jgi:endonuclease III
MYALHAKLDVGTFDLHNTLVSSFACYLFQERITPKGSVWVGLADPITGIELSQSGDEVDVVTPDDQPETMDYASRYVTGLWHTPEIVAKQDRAKEIINLLATKIVPGIRIPKLFMNKWQVLISAILSIHARTSLSRGWFPHVNGLTATDYASRPPLEIAGQIRQKIGKSPGFRIRYIRDMMKDLSEKFPGVNDPLEFLADSPFPIMRQRLLNVESIGPKVCDCFLLNAVGDIDSPPVDIHVKRVSEYLGILPPNIGYPTPEYCRNYTCSEEWSQHYGLMLCPKAERTIEYLETGEPTWGTCVRSALIHNFRNAGWVQAMLFLFGIRHCVLAPRRGPSCQSCPLKDYCCVAHGDDKRKDIITPLPKRMVRHPNHPITSSEAMPMDRSGISLFALYASDRESTLERAELIRREANGKGLFLGRKRDLLDAACLLLACRTHRLPVIVKEVALRFGVKASDLTKLAAIVRNETSMPFCLVDPMAFCDRVTRKLGVPDTVLKTAGMIIVRRKPSDNPISVAAAAIYLAAGMHGYRISEKDVAKTLMITEVTVRNMIKRLSLQ